MVGLPARGKSYLSNKLQRYLLVSSMFTLIKLSTKERGLLFCLTGMMLIMTLVARDYLDSISG